MHPSRERVFTDVVYGGPNADRKPMRDHMERQHPGPSPYKIFFGEIHGHTELSDGWGTPGADFTAARGNFWQDALERGARIGCIAGSDIHSPFPGLEVNSGHANLRHDQPGIAPVLAEKLSREAVFDAIRQRRCYACEGARSHIDFRINGKVMGSELPDTGAPAWRLFFHVTAPEPLATITIVKNARDHFLYDIAGTERTSTAFVTDLEAERPTDYDYLRVAQSDGRRAWSSPIWVEAAR
ncbi:MAG: DUF3604 domain-containing protein [Lentisphaeria bacterium]|nr:DUF3604 domain-containing protein [Lentisphaeria bacterium]